MQNILLVGGPQAVADKLRDHFGPVVFRFGESVNCVLQDKNGVRVSTMKHRYKARKAVIAIAQPHFLGLHFDPPLPARKTELVRDMSMAAFTEVFAAYKTPFWRLRELTGEIFNLNRFVSVAHDVTIPSSLLPLNDSRGNAYAHGLHFQHQGDSIRTFDTFGTARHSVGRIRRQLWACGAESGDVLFSYQAG